MRTKNPREGDERKTAPQYAYRAILAILIGLLIVAYTAAVLFGRIPEERKLNTVDLALVVLGVMGVVLLLRPDAFARLKLLEAMGFKLELLEEVKEQQARQESQLEDIALILPLLLPEHERSHLLNLADGNTSGYQGNHAVRSELRRLRSVGLIKMRPHRTVGELSSGTTFDLADYVELTDLGERWIDRIREVDKAEAPENN